MQRFQDQAAALEDPAGLTEQKGPGVVVTLSDAPEEVIDAATGDKNPLVVHQQDIEAVVNAMWKGGAEAVVLQGQRIVTTTGIKCEGNSVVIQGVPYPQPYVVEAVGDVGELTSAISSDRYLQIYREQANDPAIAVGWDLDLEDGLEIPIAGTSFSAAYVSGLAALVRQRFPELTAAQVMNRITATARHPGGGADNVVGAGVVDPVAALTWDVPPGPATIPYQIKAIPPDNRVITIAVEARQ